MNWPFIKKLVLWNLFYIKGEYLGILVAVSVLQLLMWTYLFSDISIFIDVVQVESPVEFLLDCASQEDRKAHDKILQWKQDSLRTVQNMNCKNQNQQDKQKVKIFTMQIYSVFQLVSYVNISARILC